MPETTEETTVSFRVHAVRVVRAAIDVQAQMGVDPAKLNFNVAPVVAYNTETSTVVFALQVYVATSENTEAAFAHLITEFEIHVSDPSEGTTEDTVAIPNELLQAGMAMAISTTRGILWQRGLGTVLEKAPLPAIKPDDMLASAIAGNLAAGSKARDEMAAAPE